jgi:hypothetical protein
MVEWGLNCPFLLGLLYLIKANNIKNKTTQMDGKNNTKQLLLSHTVVLPNPSFLDYYFKNIKVLEKMMNLERRG